MTKLPDTNFNYEIEECGSTYTVLLLGRPVGKFIWKVKNRGCYVEEGAEKPYFKAQYAVAQYLCYKYLTKYFIKNIGENHIRDAFEVDTYVETA